MGSEAVKQCFLVFGFVNPVRFVVEFWFAPFVYVEIVKISITPHVFHHHPTKRNDAG